MRALICVLPGDGIGPEVVAEARRRPRAVAKAGGHTFERREALIGGAAIDATGSALPPATLELAQQSDAVLLGAVGGPKWDDPRAKVRPEQGLLAIRQVLGLYANLRPVRRAPRARRRVAASARARRGRRHARRARAHGRPLLRRAAPAREGRRQVRAVDTLEYTDEEVAPRRAPRARARASAAARSS